MTGFLMIIFSAAGLVVAFEIGRLVHVHEEAGRCVSCAGTGRLRGGARCSPCGGTGRAVPAGAADQHQVRQSAR
jgi:RecJ-like exonuclease